MRCFKEHNYDFLKISCNQTSNCLQQNKEREIYSECAYVGSYNLAAALLIFPPLGGYTEALQPFSSPPHFLLSLL